jgi:hypothetical protein
MVQACVNLGLSRSPHGSVAGLLIPPVDLVEFTRTPHSLLTIFLRWEALPWVGVSSGVRLDHMEQVWASLRVPTVCPVDTAQEPEPRMLLSASLVPWAAIPMLVKPRVQCVPSERTRVQVVSHCALSVRLVRTILGRA